jgi:hypothetical protein
MGEHSEGIAASSGGGKNNGLGSCQAHHVGISPQEDRGGTAGKVGEGEGCEKEIGGLAVWGACYGEYVAGCFSDWRPESSPFKQPTGKPQ